MSTALTADASPATVTEPDPDHDFVANSVKSVREPASTNTVFRGFE